MFQVAHFHAKRRKTVIFFTDEQRAHLESHFQTHKERGGGGAELKSTIHKLSQKTNLSEAQIRGWLRNRKKRGEYKGRRLHHPKKIRALEWVFQNHTNYPPVSLNKKLAVLLEMDYKQVKKWFQSRRHKREPSPIVGMEPENAQERQQWALLLNSLKELVRVSLFKCCCRAGERGGDMLGGSSSTSSFSSGSCGASSCLSLQLQRQHSVASSSSSSPPSSPTSSSSPALQQLTHSQQFQQLRLNLQHSQSQPLPQHPHKPLETPPAFPSLTLSRCTSDPSTPTINRTSPPTSPTTPQQQQHHQHQLQLAHSPSSSSPSSSEFQLPSLADLISKPKPAAPITFSPFPSPVSSGPSEFYSHSLSSPPTTPTTNNTPSTGFTNFPGITPATNLLASANTLAPLLSSSPPPHNPMGVQLPPLHILMRDKKQIWI